MARQKNSNLKSAIAWLFLLLLLVGGVSVIFHFAGIGKDEITDLVNPVFRIEYDGNTYKADTDNVIALPKTGQARFEVKGTNAYTVVILPNVTSETDFTYLVNGKTYNYGDETDLSSAFGLKCYDNAFTVTAGSDYTLESVLSKLWGGKEITISEHDNFPPYKFVITSSSGNSIELLLTTYITGITLPENIMF